MLKLNSSSSITWRKVDYHFWVMKMCMGTWKWHCIEIILTFQSSKDWPLSTEINPTSSPYYLLSDLKVSLQNKQRLMASCYFPYDIVSFPKETRQNFPPKFYSAGGLLQQQYPMVWSCAVLKLQVGLSCSIPPYLYVYHTRWLLSTSKLKLRNYTCIIFLTEYPCKNTLTGITDFFIMCLGQVNLTKEEWESHILQ